jgi:hypothetical protein
MTGKLFICIFTQFTQLLFMFLMCRRHRRHRRRPPPQTAPFSERTVTLTLAETCAMVREHPYHYALIKNGLTEYGLVYHLRLSKKKSTGGNDFFPKVLRPEKRK